MDKLVAIAAGAGLVAAVLATAGVLLAASGCATGPASPAAQGGGAAPAGPPCVRVGSAGTAFGGTATASGAVSPVGAVGAAGPTCSERAAAAAYLALATPANKRLDHDFDAFDGPDRAALAAARADLRDIAATERAFDHGLAALTLPRDAAAWSRTLIRSNEARADLTAQAAASTSLAGLNGLRPSLTAANAPVERAVTAIRHDLCLPPPATS